MCKRVFSLNSCFILELGSTVHSNFIRAKNVEKASDLGYRFKCFMIARYPVGIELWASKPLTIARCLLLWSVDLFSATTPRVIPAEIKSVPRHHKRRNTRDEELMIREIYHNLHDIKLMPDFQKAPANLNLALSRGIL